jgi:hypothetical protein
MRRLIVTISMAGVLLAAVPGTVLADAGNPGGTFPEQPGTNVQGGCTAVTTNPGTGAGGQASQNGSPTASAITTALLTDACFGG